jgi:hypothetical protein
MLILALLTAALPAQDPPSFERMVQCAAYHWQWQNDENKAGKPVYADDAWYMAFRDRMRAAGEAKGLNRHKVSDMTVALVKPLNDGLTAEEQADWAKCQKETGWAPDPGSKRIN